MFTNFAKDLGQHLVCDYHIMWLIFPLYTNNIFNMFPILVAYPPPKNEIVWNTVNPSMSDFYRPYIHIIFDGQS